MTKNNKQVPIEVLLGEAQSVFVALEELHLKELNHKFQDIKDEINRGYQALERLHERLGIYKGSKR